VTWCDSSQKDWAIVMDLAVRVKGILVDMTISKGDLQNSLRFSPKWFPIVAKHWLAWETPAFGA
jgi:hypothetical protein